SATGGRVGGEGSIMSRRKYLDRCVFRNRSSRLPPGAHAFPALLLLVATCTPAAAQRWSTPSENDFTLQNFHFDSGESLASLRLHYRTLGAPRRDAAGVVRNGVLILHGTTGSGR